MGATGCKFFSERGGVNCCARGVVVVFVGSMEEDVNEWDKTSMGEGGEAKENLRAVSLLIG